MAVFIVASAVSTDALAPDLVIETFATSSEQADWIYHPSDLVSIYETGSMSTALINKAIGAAQLAGAPATPSRGFTIGLRAVRRGATVVQEARAAGWAFPMSVTSLPLDVIGAVMGRDIAQPISYGMLVMGQTTASIRGAQAGDTVDLVAVNGSIKTFTIGMVAPDAAIGGTEILMGFAQSDQLGATLTTSVLVYGQFDRNSIESAMATYGVTGSTKIRVRRSWDPFDPDSQLSMSRMKLLLGEFDYDYAHITNDGWTAMSPEWKAANLPSAKETYASTGIKAQCHLVVQADLRAALDEVASTYPGLVNTSSDSNSKSSGIDVANTNKYGGCGIGLVRFARITQNLGSISRHSWAMPIDMSTVSNCQGCIPKMDCRIVQIFRAHGYIWGGNFLTPDGMHFEWVGEPRDTQQYPSRFCPNPASPGRPNGEPSAQPPTSQADTFFANDGFALASDD